MILVPMFGTSVILLLTYTTHNTELNKNAKNDREVEEIVNKWNEGIWAMITLFMTPMCHMWKSVLQKLKISTTLNKWTDSYKIVWIIFGHPMPNRTCTLL